jgi:hypothetical protein
MAAAAALMGGSLESAATAIDALTLLASNAAAQMEHLHLAPECGCSAPHVGTAAELAEFACAASRSLETTAMKVFRRCNKIAVSRDDDSDSDSNMGCYDGGSTTTPVTYTLQHCRAMVFAAVHLWAVVQSGMKVEPPPLVTGSAHGQHKQVDPMVEAMARLTPQLMTDLQALASSNGLAWGRTHHFYLVWGHLLLLMLESSQELGRFMAVGK